MVIIATSLTIAIVPTKLELYLLGKRIKQLVLNLWREFCKDKVSLRLEWSPDLFKSTWIKDCKCHEIHWIKSLLRIVESAFAITYLRIFLLFLQHLTCAQSWNGNLLGYIWNHVNQTFGHNLIVGCRYGKELLQHLTIVICILNRYRHSSVYYTIC